MHWNTQNTKAVDIEETFINKSHSQHGNPASTLYSPVHLLLRHPAVLIVLFTLPWLLPPIYGPTPSVPGLLVAWGLLMLLVAAWLPYWHVATRGWLLAAGLSSVFALLQAFESEQHFFGLISASDGGAVFANLRQRNQFATLTSIGLAVLLLSPPQWVVQAGRVTWRGGSALALLAVANAASSSRTGLLELVLLLGVFSWWAWRNGRPWADARVRVTALAYAMGAWGLIWLAESHNVGAGGILSRAPESAAGCGSRRVLWANVWHLIQQKPWAGWGWGELDYAHFITLYPGERFCDILDNAHNLPLQLAVELGLPTAAMLCVAAAIWIWRQAPWQETRPDYQTAWAILALIGLHSMLEYPLWYGPFQIAAVLCVTYLWRSKLPVLVLPEKIEQRYPALILIRFVAISLIALLAYVGWDYWRVSLLYVNPSERPAAYKDHTLAHASRTNFFQNQVQFAALNTTPLNRSNAESRNRQALQLLHFSPEPAVVEAIIESAALMGDDAQALYFLQRYKAAFPEPHAQWALKSLAFQRPDWAGIDKTP